jgi:AcrR family transcriptional regulator
VTPTRTAIEEVPRTQKRASALPPGERRSMIVQATLPLLLEHGEMVTTRQIADAAGIAEGTIFRVFADKDELIAAVLDAALGSRLRSRSCSDAPWTSGDSCRASAPSSTTARADRSPI